MTKYGGIYLDKKTNTYYVSTTFVTKDKVAIRKVKRGFKTKRDADAWKQEQKQIISKITFESVNKKKTELEIEIEEYIKYSSNCKKPKTIINFNSFFNIHFIPFFKDYNLNDLTTRQINDYYNKICNSNLKNRTKNFIIGYTLTFIEWLDMMEYISTDIYKKFKRIMVKLSVLEQPVNDYLTRDEINALISSIDCSTNFGIQRKIFYSIAAYAGLRLGETTGLLFGDIDFLNNRISVTKQLQTYDGEKHLLPYTKTNQNKVVDIPEELTEMLLKYKNKIQASSTDFVIDIKRRTLQRYLKIDLKNAGLKEIRVHDLRHSYCTMLYDMGADEKYVASQMGHSTSTTSKKTYEHLTNNKIEFNKTNIIKNLMH